MSKRGPNTVTAPMPKIDMRMVQSRLSFDQTQLLLNVVGKVIQESKLDGGYHYRVERSVLDSLREVYFKMQNSAPPEPLPPVDVTSARFTSLEIEELAGGGDAP